MTQAKPGDKVRVHYTGTLTDGSTFDSSDGRDPLEFTIGSGQIIPGLDNEIPGMAVGDEKTVTIAPEDAYGHRDPSRTQAIPRSQIPDNIPTTPGTQLQMQSPEGQVIPVVIVAESEAEVTLDANHPLAGQELTFKVELVEIV
jgi:peptidylprolyl isomerase